MKCFYCNEPNATLKFDFVFDSERICGTCFGLRAKKTEAIVRKMAESAGEKIYPGIFFGYLKRVERFSGEYASITVEDTPILKTSILLKISTDLLPSITLGRSYTFEFEDVIDPLSIYTGVVTGITSRSLD